MANVQPTSGGIPLPSPPFIQVEGITNFRDLGGYPISASPNLSIRKGLIFRCGDPSKVTATGISTLQSLGITHTYDLRSINEIRKNTESGRGGVAEWDGCERVFVPIFKEEDYSPEGIAARFKDYSLGTAEGFTRAYAEILRHAPEAYKTILLHIANEPEKPLIVHCTAGKDRTGLICALLLSLCGVPDEVVAEEYQLTELGLGEYTKIFIEHLLKTPAMKGNPDGARRMISAKASNMMATLEMIRQLYGSAEGYMTQQCGLSKEEVDRIRKNLTVEAFPVH